MEFGISEMMVDLHRTYDKPLTHDRLFQWHTMLTNGRRNLVDKGIVLKTGDLKGTRYWLALDKE
ncbi:hypothetical protein [Pricia sp.]|uniref:hypothetical protein n=1 Tax=Pricia sp. TaxID=2268138 RepID=UPI003593409F